MLSLNGTKWGDLSFLPEDVNPLFHYLLDLGRPASRFELAGFVLEKKLQQIREQHEKQQASLRLYKPKDHYKPGDRVQFPALGGLQGDVIAVRRGHNPAYDDFDVFQVKFSSGKIREFAAGLTEHILNKNDGITDIPSVLSVECILQDYQELIIHEIEDVLKRNSDFIYHAGRWFLTPLLLNVNPGYLNLAEALLDMLGGGPLPTKSIIEQIDIKSSDHPDLLEFSFDILLTRDTRFDDVGPAGEVQWFLHRMEPESVQKTPIYLSASVLPESSLSLPVEMHNLEIDLNDELSNIDDQMIKFGETAKVHLIYPHWRSGTLPLTPQVSNIFPSAYESLRVRFMLIDADDGKKFQGWVVRPGKYIDGIGKWYQYKGLVPGSIFYISRGNTPGEVIVSAKSRKLSREWLCTVLMGNDNKPVFSMLKHPIRSEYDDLLTIIVPETERIDKIWLQPNKRYLAFKKLVLDTAHDLSKLNPQGHVHAKQLYAAVNLFMRCPPKLVFNILLSDDSFVHVGDLYFHPQGDD